MCSFGDAVLLEGSVYGVSRELRLGTERLVGLLAKVTGETGSIEPFDAGILANLNVFDQLTAGYNNSCSFVATNQGKLGGL